MFLRNANCSNNENVDDDDSGSGGSHSAEIKLTTNVTHNNPLKWSRKSNFLAWQTMNGNKKLPQCTAHCVSAIVLPRLMKFRIQIMCVCACVAAVKYCAESVLKLQQKSWNCSLSVIVCLCLRFCACADHFFLHLYFAFSGQKSSRFY